MKSGTEIILCPICAEIIHRHYAAPIFSRATMSSRATPQESGGMLTYMMLEADAMHERIVRAAEAACIEHFQARHSRRLHLWQRFGWNWLLTKRWPWQRANAYEQFEFPAS